MKAGRGTVTDGRSPDVEDRAVDFPDSACSSMATNRRITASAEDGILRPEGEGRRGAFGLAIRPSP